ncbi:MAG: SRPBCC family protein [Cyanobium sp.]
MAQQPAGGSGGRPTLKGQQGRYTTTIQVAATPARAWSVLTDYTAMAGVMPDIKEVRVLRRQGPRVELQQTYQAPYTFGRRIKATLVMQETAPRQLTYQLIKGEQIRQLRGQWSITPVRGGVLLSHQLEVDPEMPGFVRPLYFELTETNLQQSMRILKRLMEAG